MVFRYRVSRRYVDDERQIKRWKEIVSRFKGKLVNMIRDVGCKFDDYSLSPKIRQICYIGVMNESKVICCSFVKKDFSFLLSIKMSHYWFNREEVLQKTKEKYDSGGGKEKAAEYYKTNNNVLKEKARNRYRHLSEKEKEAERKYSKNRYKEMKKNANLFLSCINE